MNKKCEKEWWRPEEEGGFFGPHYMRGDDSLEGPYVDRPRTLEQRTITEVNQITRLLELDSSQHILDCPCGYGRHSLELLRRGIQVTGVDINPYFISLIENQVRREGLNDRATFLVGDMRRIPVGDNEVDKAMNVFTSLGFFYSELENAMVLKEFYRTLKPGGKLLVHLDFNYFRIIHSSWEEREQRPLKDGSTLFVNDSYDTSTRRIYGQWEIVPSGGGTSYERYYSWRVYSPEELTALLTECGFVNVMFLGDLDESIEKLDEHSTETVILAEKPSSQKH
jgi:ubiquinone/menaquinone biosynthesis C-methylase UbiE